MRDNIRWEFRRPARGEINSDPTNAEFFTGDENYSPADSIVREVIQNSLDARLGSEAVKIRIFFPDASLGSAAAEIWSRNLWPHAHAAGSGLRKPPQASEQVDFLVIEDFGTRGLCGDPEQDHDRAATGEQKNDFFYFWRNVGRSVKVDSDRGRWGLGKTVLPAASRAQAFFGLTFRSSDQRTLLLGQAMLKTHRIEQENFSPFGYFGQIHDDAFASPIEDEDVIKTFCDHFQLLRRSAFGLSLVIPFPAFDITPRGVLLSCIAHYFYPVLAGDLIIEIAVGSMTTLLDHESLRSVVEQLPDEAVKGPLLKLVDMTAEAQAFSLEQLVGLNTFNGKKNPKWNDEIFPHDQADILRDRWNAGNAIGFRIPLRIQRVGWTPEGSHFDVFLKRDQELEKAEDHYIRQGITITEVKGLKHPGVRGIVVATDGPLCALLGDAENPAHTEWNERSEHFREKYEHGASVLRFVKSSLQAIAGFLNKTAEGIDPNLLSGLFSIEIPDAEHNSAGTRTRDLRGKKAFAPFELEVHSGPDNFVLTKTSGGLRVSCAGAAGRTPGSLVIEAAFEVRRGDPFRKYSPLDFDFGDGRFDVLAKGASITLAKGNRVEARIQEIDFAIRIEGFDALRDVRVRVTEGQA